MHKTKYIDVISDLINHLEEALSKDLGDERIRYELSAKMVNVYYSCYSIEEKNFITEIMNRGEELDKPAKDEEDPRYDEEIAWYRGKVEKEIEFLRSALPEGQAPKSRTKCEI